jgi:hypothetical protein
MLKPNRCECLDRLSRPDLRAFHVSGLNLYKVSFVTCAELCFLDSLYVAGHYSSVSFSSFEQKSRQATPPSKTYMMSFLSMQQLPLFVSVASK